MKKFIDKIKRIIEINPDAKKAFDDFLEGLQKNINPSLNQDEAIEMLAQHVITKPVFEALFKGYSFVKNNPVSVSMQNIMTILDENAIEKETEQLQKFYESVRKRAEGIDNAEGRQKVIIELYNKFFKTAFPKLVERLGIVYTPVELVDFIINFVNEILKKEFGRTISDENINILEPFVGTGTFITRLLQSGLIKKKDLKRKYEKEIHANEIVLLAYYIAAVNIENAYHDIIGGDYVDFNGICLTDTFQLYESDDDSEMFEHFKENSERIRKQKKKPIQVIIGNPPYSKNQKSANDNAQNQTYPKLEQKIRDTYAEASYGKGQGSGQDSYIKAFRWSTDRLNPNENGIICFVSNSGWLDSISLDGFRKTIEEEFSKIYVFNLRGNARTSGEYRRKEGGGIFDSGSRASVTITLLIKSKEIKKEKAEIFYYDIGDYLKKEEKLKIIKDFSRDPLNMKWKLIKPNKFGDWLNQRGDEFYNFTTIKPEKLFVDNSKSYFSISSTGISTSRDVWAYNFSKKELSKNMNNMTDFYNSQLDAFKENFEEKKRKSKKNYKSDEKMKLIKDFIDYDDKKISWSRKLWRQIRADNKSKFTEKNIRVGVYRPFCKQYLYFEEIMTDAFAEFFKIFPNDNLENFVICVSTKGFKKEFTPLFTDNFTDTHLLDNGTQCFPLYYYEESSKEQVDLFEGKTKYERKDGISYFILNKAHRQYGKNVGKEDIFYYVYGILHSKDYVETFKNDLRKSSPHIPLVDDVKAFWKFSKAGRQLAELHINYEKTPPYKDLVVTGDDSGFYTVKKMKFVKKDKKDKIIYNSKITISNIPDKAYEYVVNGKSAIEWIMDRYQLKTDKKSGITNDPNLWCEEIGNPRYILDLLMSIVTVSVKTVDIINSLPGLRF